MTMRLRPATAEDLPAVVAVFLACWRVSYRGLLPDEVLGRMTDEGAERLGREALADPGASVLVAEDDTRVVGVTRWTAGDGTVQSLYVDPGHQGAGTGRALLDAAVAALAEGGAHRARLWVFAANTAARGFYARHGWHPEGTVRTQPQFGASELALVREIP